MLNVNLGDSLITIEGDPAGLRELARLLVGAADHGQAWARGAGAVGDVEIQIRATC